MTSKKYTPTITTQEFDRVSPALCAALRRRFETSRADATPPPSNAATAGAFDHLPEIDSKDVARWSSTVRDFLGCKLDPDLIRKGGYDSFEECWRDLSAKLRASCPVDASSGITAEMSA